jgi:hypothetical protein
MFSSQVGVGADPAKARIGISGERHLFGIALSRPVRLEPSLTYTIGFAAKESWYDRHLPHLVGHRPVRRPDRPHPLRRADRGRVTAIEAW